MLSRFSADSRYAIRLYSRTAGTSLPAVVVLAVAMALVTAFLSLYVDLALRPNPGFEGSRRIVTIGQIPATAIGFLGLNYAAVDRMTHEMTSIAGAAIARPEPTLIGADREEATTELVSGEFFRVLRPRLALGRGFQAADHQVDAEPVAIISHRLWRDRFYGDPGILGTTIDVSSVPLVVYMPGDEPEEERAQFRIIGVMAEQVQGLASLDTVLWLPMERAWPLFGALERLPQISGTAFARRLPGVAVAAVLAELRTRYEATGASVLLVPGTRLDVVDGMVRSTTATVHREAQRQLEQFLAGSILLALVAAGNVSLFLLARAPGRRRELGIRMAVGAPRGRLARQLATEAGLLVGTSAMLGLMGSIWLAMYLKGLPILREAEWRDVTLFDWRVLGLAGAILLVLSLLVSLAPILGLKRLGIAKLSHQISSRASPAQRLVGATQIAVAGALGAAAIALAWHLGPLMFGERGFETTNRYVVDGASDIFGLGGEEIFVEFARLRREIEAVPGVTAVAFGSPVPGERSGIIQIATRIPNPADPASAIEIYRGTADHRYIEVLGFRLLHGRAPEEGEVGVVVINQAFARALWGRDDVVGEHVPRQNGRGGEEVVGVLENLSFEHPSAAALPYVFSTLGDRVSLGLATIIETELPAAGLQEELDRIASSGALEFRMSNVRSLERLRREAIAADRARGFLTIVAAALVAILAGYGLYGTQSFLVAAGRREYAIRASLGAGPRSLGRLVLLRSLLFAWPGLVTGGLLALIVAYWLQGNDFVSGAVSPAMVTVWVFVGLILLSLTASFAPAREAKRTQPAPLLRED